MKRILVPCDFSTPSVQAFKFAADVARTTGGEVIALHAIELPVMNESVLMPSLSFEETFIKDMKANAEKNFGKMQNKWAADIKCTTRVEFGNPTTTIREFIDESKIDLVVMGTHGATGMKEFFIGSNTEKIVRTSRVPVISVKDLVKVASVRNIVFPNTLGLDQEKLMQQVKALQNFFGATLHVLYINTPSRFRRDIEVKQEMKTFAKRFLLKDYTLTIFNDFSEEEGLRNFIADIKADLVAMATHGRKGLNHLMSGSIAEDAVNHLPCPIWTFKMS
ncbi:MAG: universal stress protein [Cyclobacteriaceae bacterium]|nr:universal stress protein [Cyclobacteriaceae bacterium]